MEGIILQTKINIPRQHTDVIPRPRLFQLLNNGLNKPLVLVSAPAGFGKTTLITAWLETSTSGKQKFGWLSVDKEDNDPTRFWSHFFYALKKRVPVVDEELPAILHSPQAPPVKTVLVSLINQMATVSYDMYMVLDDYQNIDDHEIHDNISFLLANLPPQLHVVLISRSDPPLPLARFRARGQLVEIRSVDLRFTMDEATVFLVDKMGLTLTHEEILQLETRVEGWVVGLQLSGLALKKHANKVPFIKELTAGHSYIIDYLTEEVLKQQPGNIQTFLLKTSVLERLCGSLCNAVTGGNDGQAVLEALSASNMFLVPLDDERVWYRYHHLFAQMLSNRLRQNYPDTIGNMHKRAFEWYVKNDLKNESLFHAFQAGDFDRAAELIQSISTLVIGRGELRTVQNWIELLPEDIINSHPRLSISLAWIFNISQRGDNIEPILQKVERAIESGTMVPAEAAELRGHVALLKAYAMLSKNAPQKTLQLMEEALNLLPESEVYLRSVARFTQGVIYKRGEIWERSIDLLREAQHLGETAGNYAAALGACNHLIELFVIRGRLRQASQICRQTISWYETHQMNAVPNLGFVHIKLGEILYEWNELDAAKEHLAVGMALSSKLMVAWAWIRDGLICQARIAQSEGQSGTAQSLLEQAIAVNDEMHDVFDKMDMTAWQARLWIAQRKHASTATWAREYQSSPGNRNEFSDVVLARVLIANGNNARAIEILTGIRDTAKTSGRDNRQIEVSILLSLACLDNKEQSKALDYLSEALSLAEPDGYVRIFIEEGQNIESLLSLMLQYRLDNSEVVFSQEYVRRLLTAFPEPINSNNCNLLSSREVQILRLLHRGFKTSEIAGELFLSTNTVKWYLKNIYSKLGVHRRADAIARSSELGFSN